MQNLAALGYRHRNHRGAPIFRYPGESGALVALGIDEHQRNRDRAQNLGWIATDGFAVPVQHLQLGRGFLEAPEPVS